MKIGILTNSTIQPTKYGYDWDLGDDCCFKPDVQPNIACSTKEIDIRTNKCTTTCDSTEIDEKGEARSHS